MIYKSVCTSLFEKHKILFSFLLSCKTMISENKLDDKLYNFLI